MEHAPDIVVVPRRGAEPLIRGIQLIATLDRNSRRLPRVCFINVGEIDRMRSAYPVSHNEPSKLAETKKKLSDAIQGWNERNPGLRRNPRILLLDEARVGGAMAKGFNRLQTAMRKLGLNPIHLTGLAITESGQRPHPPFNKLVQSGRIWPIYIRDVFTMDRTPYLSPLVRLDERRTKVLPENLSSRLDFLKALAEEHRRRNNGRKRT